MTREDIIRMAREAGFKTGPFNGEEEVFEGDGHHIQTDMIADFAALVAAAEREACARVCDNLAIDRGTFHPDDQDIKTGLLAGAAMCAATIKARGQK